MNKSIKFKDNIYLDTESIVHNKINLKQLLGYKPLCYFNIISNDFNDFYNPGIYSIGGFNMLNAPHNGYIYGVLIVITNNGNQWKKTNTSSWMWQLLFTTGADIWMRLGINSEVPDEWKKLH